MLEARAAGDKKVERWKMQRSTPQLSSSLGARGQRSLFLYHLFFSPIASQPATIFCGPSLVSKIVRRLEEIPGRWDFSSVRTFMVGGDMMNKFAHERFATALSNSLIYQLYGATEVGLVFKSEIGQPIVYGSVGKPISPVKVG